MAKLILSMDGLVLKEIPLNKERLSIGRKAHNDVQIDNLAISGEHAVVVSILNDSFLEDMNSTNGTQVNGQPIKKHFLRHNDVIELGKYKLKYMNDPTASVNEDQPKGAAARSAAAQAPVELELEHDGHKPTVSNVGLASSSIPTAAIQLLNGANAGKELELTKKLTTLGKPGLQVAVITMRQNGYFITHVEGKQPPTVNSQPLTAQAQLLCDHDVIEIAGTKMEFFLKG